MFSIGSTIRDRAGNEWVVTQTWTYNQYLCLSLVGKMGGTMQGQMGGARFKEGDAIYIRR